MPTPPTKLNRGLEAHACGDLDVAKCFYEQVLAVEPNCPTANGWLGTIEAQRKNFPRARLLLEKAALSNDPNFLLNYANLLQEVGEYKQALVMYLKLSGRDPNRVLFSNMAACYNELLISDKGLRFADEALAIDPSYADAWSNRGIALRNLKRYEEALAAHERSIELKADSAETWNNHGLVLIDLKRSGEALLSFERAIELNRGHTGALYNRGFALIELSRYEEAMECYVRYLQYCPGHAPGWNNLGITFVALRRFGDAFSSYEKATILDPGYAEVFYNCGNALNDLGCYEDALDYYEQAVVIKPDYAGAWNNRGNTLNSLRRYEEALDSYERAIELKPDYGEAWSNRGIVLAELEQHDAALMSFQQSIALSPDCAETFYNLGNLFNSRRHWQDALENYERSIQLNPGHAEAWNNRGVVLRELGRHEEAVTSHEASIEISCDYAEAWYNRGVSLGELRRVDEALASYNRAIDLNPETAGAHWNKSLELLRLGTFKLGWQLYEWRWQVDSFSSSKRTFTQPIWLGDQPLEGKTLLLHSEQGYGDSIQFCRYGRLIKNLGARVILEVDPPLTTLLTTVDGVDIVVGKGESLPDFDFHCPLLSLPLAFKTEVSSIPSNGPYLHASQDKKEKWSKYLSINSVRLPLVGIVWSGNPKHKNDQNRSVGLQTIKELFSNKLSWVCLQRDLSPADRQLLKSAGVRDYVDKLDDFSDTAALISCLDLVISVDTSVAHLAGALGKPVWVLLPYVPDFRWMWDREDSPWYPSMRLFRQSGRGDWDVVISKIDVALADVFLT